MDQPRIVGVRMKIFECQISFVPHLIKSFHHSGQWVVPSSSGRNDSKENRYLFENSFKWTFLMLSRMCIQCSELKEHDIAGIKMDANMDCRSNQQLYHLHR